MKKRIRLSDPAVAATRQLLASYVVESETNVNRLAAICGVPQYTLWRFLAGKTKSIGRDVEKVLTYANIEVTSIKTANLLADKRLQAALVAAWDGSSEGVLVLAEMLEAIGPWLKARRLSSKAASEGNR